MERGQEGWAIEAHEGGGLRCPRCVVRGHSQLVVWRWVGTLGLRGAHGHLSGSCEAGCTAMYAHACCRLLLACVAR